MDRAEAPTLGRVLAPLGERAKCIGCDGRSRLDFDVNGIQNWATKKAWAEGLSFAGSSDWALPSISDYGTLFSEVGDLTLVSQFTNVQPDVYWSGTEFTPGFNAWFFFPGFGGQSVGFEDDQLFAVAVRPGDVAASVPEPQTLALALLALSAGAVAWRRRPP